MIDPTDKELETGFMRRDGKVYRVFDPEEKFKSIKDVIDGELLTLDIELGDE